MCAAKVLHLRHQADQRKGLTVGLEVFCMRDQLQLHRLPPPVEPSGTHGKSYLNPACLFLWIYFLIDPLKKNLYLFL